MKESFNREYRICCDRTIVFSDGNRQVIKSWPVNVSGNLVRVTYETQDKAEKDLAKYKTFADKYANHIEAMIARYPDFYPLREMFDNFRVEYREVSNWRPVETI